MGYDRDVLAVRMLTGQTATGWQAQSAAFAHTFGATSAHVTCPEPGWVTITVHHHNSLAAPIWPAAPAENIDLERVPVAVVDAGQPWRVRGLAGYQLIGGVTGAGKGTMVWSVIAGMAPAIRAGLVQLQVTDPRVALA